MKNRSARRSGAVLLVVLAASLPPIAATVATAATQRDPAQVQAARASIEASLTASRAATAARTSADDKVANPNRAYPPSCLGDGLPFGLFKASQNDPGPLQAQLILPGDYNACQTGGNANECNYQEQVTVSVWRVACSKDTLGNGHSATLLQIDRPCGACSNVSLYPTFPLVAVTQGNNSLYIRLANDPNTVFTATYANTPVVSSDIWVLENFYGSSVQFDYNQAFTLTLDNAIQFNVPAYNPANYAAAKTGLPISGYLTSNWYDPAHGGEGTLTQIFENADGTRTFSAAWYTFDKNGIPFWLYSQGVVQVGATTTGPVDTYYAKGGCFAGTGCGAATFTKWGTITYSFPDCAHMAFTFNGNADAIGGPTGSGTRTWLRIASVNSITCQ
jgi:hypothetical protein